MIRQLFRLLAGLGWILGSIRIGLAWYHNQPLSDLHSLMAVVSTVLTGVIVWKLTLNKTESR